MKFFTYVVRYTTNNIYLHRQSIVGGSSASRQNGREKDRQAERRILGTIATRGTEIESNFHFDDWAVLAKLDPEAFEMRRKRVIEAFLSNSGAKVSLGKALQREIDFERQRAATPREALQRIAKMMCQQLDFLNEQWEGLSDDVHIALALRD